MASKKVFQIGPRPRKEIPWSCLLPPSLFTTMRPRSLLLRRFSPHRLPVPAQLSRSPVRSLATQAVQKRKTKTPSPPSSSSSKTPNPVSKPSPASPTSSSIPTRANSEGPPPKSWLTRKVESSPAAKRVFLGLTNLLGYGSPKQLAGRRAFVLYKDVCAPRPEEEEAFWRNSCHLPPTFQSWFTVTNFHVWLLTARLRALPVEHARHYEQALLDHFFIDVEDRIRAVLQPPTSFELPTPYTFSSTFYLNPYAPLPDGDEGGKPKKVKPRGRAPDRIVIRQMKIFKEQWMGMGISLSLGLVKSDQELAAAIWRNLLGARGASGIVLPSSSAPDVTGTNGYFRRAVNLVGGEVVNLSKVDLEKEERTDDGSGVHDFPPEEVDKYLAYPETMLTLVGYVRRELVRLAKVSDEDILQGDWEKLKFSSIGAGSGSGKLWMC
ncbi:unnamed protein product [Cyclocybe aegerita]|uniref:Ubiquinol-cytochrome c chaperone domain-containing protein n=1 Tax=Cyclocybe aegerita TaxID=1973307 RepID=A0A8S0W401_CYCAE|nr:unnamed protein product [Cyclocybe aegerita]